MQKIRKICYSIIITSLILMAGQITYVGAQTAEDSSTTVEIDTLQALDSTQTNSVENSEEEETGIEDASTVVSGEEASVSESAVDEENISNDPIQDNALGEDTAAENKNTSADGDEIILENESLNQLNSLSSKAVIKTYCGDGIIQPSPEYDLENDDFLSEQCDDGNTENGDGCSENCQIEVCVDADEDGFGAYCGLGPDCDDENNSISPLAVEICGNGIDEDCSGDDLACPLPPAPQPPVSSGGGGGGGGGGWSPAPPADMILADADNSDNPSNFKAISSANGISLTWKNPTGSFSEVLILKSDKTMGSYLTVEQLKQASQEVYRGKVELFIDNKISLNIKYYYALMAYNNNSKSYSDPLFASATGSINELAIQDEPQVLGEELENYLNIKSLFGVSGDIADIVSFNEANTVCAQNQFVPMDEAGVSIYKKIDYNKFAYAKDIDNYNKAYFIFYGTLTTKSLGAGERGGALASYISAFRKIPVSPEEWQDVIKIANGRWPAEKNESSEELAKEKFKKIYLREPNMKNANDNAAVTVMAYGLRPANRNFDSEKAAINSYKYIYKKAPESASDWDIVRAIAYSGAKR